MLLSEHVCCMTFTFKMTEQVKQQTCIKFYIKLEHSSTETICMIQKATAMGNWWLAASSQQYPAHASHLVQSFLATHQIPQVTQPHCSPDLAPCNFWLFPKLKSPLTGKRFQTIDKIQEIRQGIWWWLVELWEVPRCLFWRGLKCHCPMYNVSYILHLLR